MNLDDTPLYHLPPGLTSHCSNVHNVDAIKGQAGRKDRFPRLAPGESLTVAELEGPAIVTRLWLTFDWPGTAIYPDAMRRNRSVELEITWDGAKRPAIRVPVGDFFCHPLCYSVPFENAFFGSPTGRSLLCFIPMPFRERARIRIFNGFDRQIVVFHDIRFLRGVEPGPDDGYLHACFRRTLPTEPGLIHPILPKVSGRGRYLGTHLGIVADRYNPLHWHGAQPKFYIDGDDARPSMIGASLDDYGGASWAYATRYMHRDSGLLLARTFALGGGHYGFYYYHRRDPLLFGKDCAVCIRPAITMSDVALQADLAAHPGLADRLALPVPPEEIRRSAEAGEDTWYECGRMDDIATVALYYLDRAEGCHPACPAEVLGSPAWQWPADDGSSLNPGLS